MTSSLQIENARLISLMHDGSSLGLQPSDWRKPLERATPDPAVGIRHEQISGNANYRLHVAAIPQQVGCHYHANGDEDYAVVEGTGVLFFGPVVNGTVVPDTWKSIAVRVGDSFVIPEGYAHQLRKIGAADLTIVFGCPDSHLSDDSDRYLLPDAPRMVGGLSADQNQIDLNFLNEHSS
ncbi:MAG: hypothetical protein HC825_00185 [Oscillatoriales cyanobacterium RM1_1_9]|nr:hypothetical protein [Oscillatoriales cyanobacterium SM2_3_0]NJO45791.1 hypothetical protein [Oscillatoriales cyanobacterium RM2_1_1]NJO70547.1 hypothetical protein [Oscillatoriales cyanobacterium RM1_1_9]